MSAAAPTIAEKGVWCHNDLGAIMSDPASGQLNETSMAGQYIINLLSSDVFTNVLDIGTWTGNGSTRCMLLGLQKTRYERFISVECNQDKHALAQRNLASLLNPEKDALLWGSIVTADEVSLDKVVSVFPRVARNSEFCRWHTVDVDNIKLCPNVLEMLPETLDLVLFDGGEFTTHFEFNKLFRRCTKYILMDDCNVDKCRMLRAFMKQHPEWTEISYIPERNGFCAFKKNT
jgi:hypothetical protein